MNAKDPTAEEATADRAALVNRERLAELCSVTPRTIANWRKFNGLPFVDVGGRIMYRVADVDAWLASKVQVIAPESGREGKAA